MNIRLVINALISDLRFIIRDPVLFVALTVPLFLVFLLRLVFPVLAESLFPDGNDQGAGLYVITAVSVVSLIPVITGMVTGYMLFRENQLNGLLKNRYYGHEAKKSLLIRSGNASVISFFLLIFAISLSVPVSSEGWLRTLFITGLLSLQAALITFITAGVSSHRLIPVPYIVISVLFVISLPLGLLVHSPWNYLFFLSPFYWISWAWVVPSSSESLTFGLISLFTASAYSVLLFKYLSGK